MEHLTADTLDASCDPASLPFRSTAEVEPGAHLAPGQQRVLEALRFGVDMRHEGYNLFVLGPTGSGRHHLVLRFLEGIAKERPTADDWVYTRMFSDPSRPNAIRMPAGKGRELKADMERMVADLKVTIPSIFESDEYRDRREALANTFAARQEAAIREVAEEAQKRDIALMQTPTGVGIAITRDGKVLSPEEVEALPEEDHKRIQRAADEVRERMHRTLREVPKWEREHQQAVRQLEREMVSYAVDHLVDEVVERWAACEEVVPYLEAVRKDVVENASRFRGGRESSPLQALMGGESDGGDRSLSRYDVNLLVDHAEADGAPLVYEDDPTLQALLGQVEHVARMGTLTTDFTMIKAGALHRANGGFLVLDARAVLQRVLAWEGLKRCLRSGEVRIESVAQAMALVSTATLRPEPIPLDVKVVLVGSRQLYHLLDQLDPEFRLLFKVPADFEDDLDRDEEGCRQFALLVAQLVHEAQLLPFADTAVASIVRQASRLAGDRRKLTTHMQRITDLLHEAALAAEQAGRSTVTDEDVKSALDSDRRRRGRIREEVLESTVDGVLTIQTEGSVIGQVNGLTVLPLRRGAFGHPVRITARVRMGRGQVLDIQREVELSGPIHSKGVLILAGFIGERYGGDLPPVLSASLVFEQTYGAVDGDSASLAETLALLSDIAKVPLRQDIAVTGSIDQRGNVQAVGGVNDKIEGFFDLCDARGLTGEQGVILPATNRESLVLHDRVLAAVAEGRFHVWVVDTVDEALALLTGEPAGEVGEDGLFPEGTVNRRVDDRIRELAEKAAEQVEAGPG